MSAKPSATPNVYTRYPLSVLLMYNGLTVLHFLLGGIGIISGYNSTELAYLVAFAYLVFAFAQMYLIMPLTVCPNCVYFRLNGSRCPSGLNTLSKMVAKEGDINHFASRSKGVLCHNNLYLTAMIFPILATLPALILNFSFLLLSIFLVVVGLLLLRMFVVLPKIVCLHCRAMDVCPNAQAMGIGRGQPASSAG